MHVSLSLSLVEEVHFFGLSHPLLPPDTPHPLLPLSLSATQHEAFYFVSREARESEINRKTEERERESEGEKSHFPDILVSRKEEPLSLEVLCCCYLLSFSFSPFHFHPDSDSDALAASAAESGC